MANQTTVPFARPPAEDEERNACTAIDPPGFHICHPPPPHGLKDFITPDALLFETIHMGPAVVDEDKWLLVIDGLVQHPFAITLPQLKQLFPRTTLTAFHECYGSPLVPPEKALPVWRVGNVAWTGVKLSALLDIAAPLPHASFVWSEGLDRGAFAGVEADRYQKDLPMGKACSGGGGGDGGEVLVAYEMNGAPLRRERGGPVRLVVPGWFGTNMTKWLCRLSVRAERAPSPFTTRWYNERVVVSPSSSSPSAGAGADDGGGAAVAVERPVWAVEPNSMIVDPPPGTRVPLLLTGRGGDDVAGAGSSVHVEISGWAWSHDGIASVRVSANDGADDGGWVDADVADRVDCSWQAFRVKLALPVGRYGVVARATSKGGVEQPMRGRRNHVHRVELEVAGGL